MFAVTEGYAHHFVCEGGGGAPPNLTQSICHNHVCSRKGYADRFVCNGGGGLRPPPKHSCRQEHHGIMFAVREGYADRSVCEWGGAAPPPTLLLS